MIIDKLNLEPNRDKKGEFRFTILPEKDKDLKFEILNIQVFTYLLMISIMIRDIQVK